MIALLLKMLLVVHLGGNSRQPIRAARVKLALAAIAAVAIGTVVATSVWHGAVSHTLPMIWILSLVAMSGFLVAGLLLLSMGAAVNSSAHRTTLQRMTLTWPLSRFHQWIVMVMPETVVLVIMALCAAPIAFAAGHALHVPPLLMIGSLLYGLGSGLGFGLARVGKSPPLKVMLFAVVIGFGMMLLSWAIRATTYWAMFLASTVVVVELAVLYAGFWQSYRAVGRFPPTESRVSPRILLNANHVYSWWFVAKILRNRRTHASLVFCLLLAIAVGVATYVHRPIMSGPGWLLFGTVLASTFAADIRGLARRYQPPEIATLQGVGFFAICQVQATFLFGLVIGLPMFLVTTVALGSSEPFAGLVLHYVSLQAAGVATGLLAGSLFVSQEGEFGAQFFASLTPTILLFVLLWLCRIGALSALQQTVSWFGVSVFCVLAVYMIEKMRSKRYGHI